MLSGISLAPVGGLPGGVITGALNKWCLPVGLAGLSLYMYAAWPAVSPVLPLLWLMSAYRTYQIFNPQNSELEMWRHQEGYYDLNGNQKLLLGVTYL